MKATDANSCVICVADLSSVNGQGPHHAGEEESQSLLSARAAVNPDMDDAGEEYSPRDEEGQSRHDSEPGTLARIIKRY